MTTSTRNAWQGFDLKSFVWVLGGGAIEGEERGEMWVQIFFCLPLAGSKVFCGPSLVGSIGTCIFAGLVVASNRNRISGDKSAQTDIIFLHQQSTKHLKLCQAVYVCGSFAAKQSSSVVCQLPVSMSLVRWSWLCRRNTKKSCFSWASNIALLLPSSRSIEGYCAEEGGWNVTKKYIFICKRFVLWYSFAQRHTSAAHTCNDVSCSCSMGVYHCFSSTLSKTTSRAASVVPAMLTEAYSHAGAL